MLPPRKERSPLCHLFRQPPDGLPALCFILLLLIPSSAPHCLVAAHSATASNSVDLTNNSARRSAAEEKIQAAREIVEEAERLRAEGSAESLTQAREKYKEALQVFSAADQRQDEVAALQSLGDLSSLLYDYKEALGYYSRALRLSRAIGNRWREVEVLNGIAGGRAFLGENQQAITLFQQALDSSRRIHHHDAEARALSGLGEAHYNLSDAQAINYLEEALKLWQTIDDPRGRAQTLRYLGYAYTDLSDLPTALKYYEQALPLWRAARDLRGEAQTINATGLLHFLLGERQLAMESYTRAEKIFRDIGDWEGLANTLNGKGEAYAELDVKQALDCHDEALRLMEAMGKLDGQIISHRYLGHSYRGLGDSSKLAGKDEAAEQYYTQAIQHYEQALSLSRALKDRRIESYSLQDIGGIYDFSGNTSKALDFYQRALKLSRVVKDPRGQALVLNSIGGIYDKLNQKQKALAYFRQALPLTRAAQAHAHESLTLYNIARVERDEGDLSTAITDVETALGIVESLRANVLGHTFRSSYFASVHKYYELKIELLMQQHHQYPAAALNVTALETSEMARARSLLDMLAESRSEIRKGIAPELLEQERQLRQMLDVKAEYQMNLLSGQHTEEQAASLEKEIRALTVRHEEVEAQIRRQNPHYAALMQPQPLSLKDIQQRILDDDTMLLEYSLGDSKSYLWMVTRTEVSSFELPGRAEIESAARRFYELLTANQLVPGESFEQRRARVAQADEHLLADAASLGSLVLGPAAAKLNKKRLIIITDGALQYVPFQALIVPELKRGDAQKHTVSEEELQPLILGYEIVNEPSASSLLLLLDETMHREPAAKAVAVLADPVFEADDPRVQSNGVGQRSKTTSEELRGVEIQQASFRDSGLSVSGKGLPRLLSSREEAEAIMSVTPTDEGLKAIDFEASREMALSPSLGQYRIVHFATHSLLNSEHPELSGIVLSLVNRQGQPQDGFLRLQDIYNLNLPADLVVLSACNTGLGQEMRGEGLIGLTRGFMHAGAGSVVATLWKVDDAATAELMSHFYERMLKDGLPPASALREAQLAMLKQKNRRSPYYWAGFVIQGQYVGKGSPVSRRAVVGVGELAAAAAALTFGVFYAWRRKRQPRALKS
jgi:CHAT domain-containing protein/tetratricopeptide (TPR) repeat protein